MLLIIDKITKKVIENHGTNSLFPDGNIPNTELKENEEAIRVNDDSEEARLILNAYDYSFQNGILKINKTLEQYKQEQINTTDYKKQIILQELTQLDIEIPRIVEDLIKHTNFKPHKSKEDTIARKNLLREQLQNLGV
jgi:hypothetical protein